MKKIFIIISILTVNLAYSQLYQNFDIPTFYYRSLQLNGDPGINIESSGGESSTNIDVDAEYGYMFQSPSLTYQYGAALDYDWDEDNYDFKLIIPFSIDQYFGHSRGLFGFASGDFDSNISGTGDFNDENDLNLTIGAGFGRIVSAKPVAQAVAIASELGGASNTAILTMAGIISKWNSGWYSSTYKDNATLQYYNDLAAAAGKPNAAMKIQQITTNPVYTIQDRSVGWEMKAGFTDNYLKKAGESTGLYYFLGTPIGGSMRIGFSLETNYAMPIGLNQQITAGFKYLKNMSKIIADGGGNVMQFDCAYRLDHTYTWATSAAFRYQTVAVSKDADPVNAMLLNISTSRSILNRLMGSASYSYLLSSEYDDPMTVFAARLTYYLF